MSPKIGCASCSSRTEAKIVVKKKAPIHFDSWALLDFCCCSHSWMSKRARFGPSQCTLSPGQTSTVIIRDVLTPNGKNVTGKQHEVLTPGGEHNFSITSSLLKHRNLNATALMLKTCKRIEMQGGRQKVIPRSMRNGVPYTRYLSISLR